MLTVDQLMTKSLVNIEYGRSAIEAAKLMKTHKVGSVFVQKDNRIIGIVTEPDIIRKVVGAERVPYLRPGRRNHEQSRHRYRLATSDHRGSRHDGTI
jgi:signal-transduction protein with cAMP-binding, CBS, and nucleotidyltransferase domain